MGGARGQATDVNIQAREILKLRQRMNEILARHTGRDVEQIAQDTERDYYMSADEAREYGVVDRVVSNRDAVGSANGSGTSSGLVVRRRSGVKKRDEGADLSCSFCGKSQKEVKKLIAGPTVYICDECIELCNDIIAEEYGQEEPPPRASARSEAEGDSRQLSTST